VSPSTSSAATSSVVAAGIDTGLGSAQAPDRISGGSLTASTDTLTVIESAPPLPSEACTTKLSVPW